MARSERDPTRFSLADTNFTIPEAADYLRISRATVYNIAKTGKLKLTKIGSRTVIRGMDIEYYLNAGWRER